ncbi:ChaN family lipoprotein [Laspinema olomoucense]|uniref:ChaN family lipoprotein n=1 Tax=Laspinema olomoucense D3b TaxID=2953688 RepID=A0ABT2N5T1_9CYAN|nr:MULTISPECIES: ChaN family lipoprotein [unclassified Laspinema]MCT7974586.1 ChaN family lipoprotein [Laspinema sp. D3d]MCT7977100.1 ChaN family lipoprotein [Laspinema sp. D3b]MCT7993606.1 ChaN family lipoprotein [Laspinema sp. D3c]
MKLGNFIKLGTCSLGIILACTLSVQGGEINPRSPGVESLFSRVLPQPQILQELREANVIYLGETHDSAADHQAQLQIIQELHRNNPNLAIAMEMFQRPFQGAIDRYLQGEITETELIAETEYEQRWGFPWEYYAEIVRFAKDNQLPILALNAPTEVIRKVARDGLEGLSEQEREYIPPFAEIKTDNLDYQQMVREVFEQHQAAAHGSSLKFENFFLAQVLWDETMAETIANFVRENPQTQVVVLAGQGHIVYGYGIPSRVERRVGDRLGMEPFVQRSLLFNLPEELHSTGDRPIADYFWEH